MKFNRLNYLGTRWRIGAKIKYNHNDSLYDIGEIMSINLDRINIRWLDRNEQLFYSSPYIIQYFIKDLINYEIQ